MDGWKEKEMEGKIEKALKTERQREQNQTLLKPKALKSAPCVCVRVCVCVCAEETERGVQLLPTPFDMAAIDTSRNLPLQSSNT